MYDCHGHVVYQARAAHIKGKAPEDQRQVPTLCEPKLLDLCFPVYSHIKGYSTSS